MIRDFKFALLAVAEAVACMGLVACGGAADEGQANNSVLSAQALEADASNGSVQAVSSGREHAMGTTTVTSWNKVADEGTVGNVGENQTVRYGSGSSWITKTISGVVLCSSQNFGGDPKPGVVKQCDVKTTTTTTTTDPTPAPAPTPAPTSSNWTKVATEYQQFTLNQATLVRYGTGDRWIEKTFNGTVYCANGTFGSDPAVGVAKQCQVQSASAPAPAPAPAPSPVVGTAVVSWKAPTANADGSTLTDLAGFNLYYGTSSGNYSEHINIANPAATTYTIPNLSAGTYYIVLKAVDASGNESSSSAEITKTIK